MSKIHDPENGGVRVKRGINVEPPDKVDENKLLRWSNRHDLKPEVVKLSREIVICVSFLRHLSTSYPRDLFRIEPFHGFFFSSFLSFSFLSLRIEKRGWYKTIFIFVLKVTRDTLFRTVYVIYYPKLITINNSTSSLSLSDRSQNDSIRIALTNIPLNITVDEEYLTSRGPASFKTYIYMS